MEQEKHLTVGLEIHIELKTRTKMFCDCLNDPDEHHPNVNICPICTGHPGTLPTINKKAVELVLQFGMALGGTIFPKGRSKFDRKNYFYPDLPKGYQISQYDEPLVLGGTLDDICIRRIHLEEDAGALTHSGSHSLVDFNRAGTPLMELVTEPDITSADQAVACAQDCQRILRYCGISDADMEKGLMRLEANISVNKGTKVEVKNINSFKAMHDAIDYEYKRQTAALENGKKIMQETRGWNEGKKETVSQRSKEDAHDYRYFPEPDLPPMTIDAFDIKKIKQEIPELPNAKRERFVKEFNLAAAEADILTDDRAAAEFFEEAASEFCNVKSEIRNPKSETLNMKLLYNYFTSDLWGLMKKDGRTFQDIRTTPEQFAHLIAAVAENTISSRVAKDVLARMAQTGADPHDIIKEQGLEQISDTESLEEIARAIIAAHPKPAEDYKKGKKQSLQFLIGKAMSELKGTANPTTLKTVFEELLK